MAIAIGYNVKQAEEVMKKVATAYKNLGIYTKEQWDPVVNVLQENWIGEDEQDFEKKFAERVCTLYSNAYNLAKGSVDTIASLVDAWYEFQANNTISGERAEQRGKVKVDTPSIKAEDSVVKYKAKNISENEDRGLANENSKATIQTAISEFVSQIKQRTTGLFQEIQTNEAFFGEQSNSIKAYIEKCGEAIGEVTVAVKDMNDALDVLANTSYTTASSDIQQEFSNAASSVEASLNDLGSSRWNS